MRKAMFVLLACLAVAASGLNPYFKIDVPPQTQNFDYSPDLKYLAIAAPSQLVIHHAQTGNLIQKIEITDVLNLDSFAFNSDSSLLALGFNNGQVDIYQYTDNNFVYSNFTYQSQSPTTISSVCFTSDNNILIIGLYKNSIVAWNYVNNVNSTIPFDTMFVNTVACSPTDPTLFVAGGALGSSSKFTFYKYTEAGISMAKDIPTKESSGVQDTAFTVDGSSVYRVGNDGVIYYYSTADYTQSKLEQTQTANKKLYKIRMSSNLRLIAVAASKTIIVFTDPKLLRAQNYTTNVDSVALTSEGGFLFAVTADGKGSTLAQCPEGTYSDNAGNCFQCTASCLICFNNPDICYSCGPKYFLDNNKCTKCEPGCLKCTSTDNCESCDEHFHKQQGFCVCDPGYFQREDTCQECSKECIVCQDQNHCISCKQKFIVKDGVCICKTGFFPIDDTCQACQRGCASCKDKETCQSCDTVHHYIQKGDACVCNDAQHFVDNTTDCICKNGYYQQAGQCQNCPLGCLTCRDSTFCYDCAEGLEKRDNLCKCIDRASYLDVDGTCKQCKNTLKYCVQCTSATNCLNCQEGTNRDPVGGKCLCREGYWEDEANICQQCTLHGCVSCQNANVCLKCDATNKWILNLDTKKCQCQRHYSEVEGKCIECSVGCKSCRSPNDCIACDATQHWILDGTSCVCMDRWYRKDDYCNKCMTGCLICQQEDVCNKCDENSKFGPVGNKCQCIAGFYPKNEACSSCIQVMNNCLECKDEQTCTKCITPLVINSTNKCGCSENHQYLDKDGVCKDCPESCATCDHQDICTSCNDGYTLDGSVCTKSGMKTLIIVIVVVAAVILIGVAIFFFIKRNKKRKLSPSLISSADQI